MIELLKLFFVVLLIAFLMWRKVDLGISLLAGSLALGVLFSMNQMQMLLSAKTAIIDPDTIEIVIAVTLIIIMGRLMKSSGNLNSLVDSLDKIVMDRRISMVIPPAFIGLLPAPGGAMLSAPMVDESGDKLGLSAEQKTYINYWFRHLWEYCWPLYPGLIVAAAITNIEVDALMRVQYPLSFAAIFAGIVFGLVPIRRNFNHKLDRNAIGTNFITFIVSIWPIWIILIGLVAFRLNILIILSVIVVILLLTVKTAAREKLSQVRQSISGKIILLLVSVMIFKQILTDSSAVEAIPVVLEASGISPLIPIALIPFILGLLTGVNQAYIGVSFPLLLPFFGGEVMDLKLIMFAYAVGFVGVLLSPVHLCLLLTKEYFKANWPGIYKLLLPSAAMVFAASLILLKL